MSGNPATPSSAGGGAGGGAGGSGKDTCVFAFTTVLGSTDPGAVAALSVGASLVVRLQANPPAVTVEWGGAVVGGIPQHAARLRNCIQQGYAYSADVVSIDGGAVQVHVRPA